MSSAASNDKGSTPNRTVRSQKSVQFSSTAIRSSTIVPEVPAASDRSSATKQDVDGIPGDAHALIAAANSSNAANIAGLKDKYGDDTKASTSI